MNQKNENTIERNEAISKTVIRVCYVASGADLGGAPRSLLEMLEALQATGCVEPFVILRRGGALEHELNRIGVPYTIIPFPSSLKSGTITNLVKKAVLTIQESRLKAFFSRENFEIVHNNGITYDTGIRAAQKAGIPVVCHVREFVEPENGIAFFDEARTRAAVSGSNMVVFISHVVAKRFENWVANVPSIVLYDGIDLDSYFVRRGVIASGDVLRLVLAGHIMPSKGQIIALQAVHHLVTRGVSVHLTVIGIVKNKDYMRQLKDYVSQYGLGSFVSFCDFTESMKREYEKSDVALICSTGKEGLGRVTIEGMLAGCLAVGPRMGATGEIICDGKTGMLYEPGDSESLADCLSYIARAPEAANLIARKGQDWAFKTFDSTQYGAKMIKIYRQIVRCGSMGEGIIQKKPLRS